MKKEIINKPKLKHYIKRYKLDKELLKKFPENKDVLEKRMKTHEKNIIDYVTSDEFESILNNFNL